MSVNKLAHVGAVNFLEDWFKVNSAGDGCADNDIKQIANRILEPWMHITTVATTSYLGNFYKLRCHPDAQPEFRELAEKMKALTDASEPTFLKAGEYHLPYIANLDLLEPNGAPFYESLLSMSVARCARVSYVRQGEARDLKEDIALHDRLKASGHWSPFEHQAQAANFDGDRRGNLAPGWIQYRKTFADENGPTVY